MDETTSGAAASASAATPGLASKTILITGASSGLGEGMARVFARRGYNLALCARRLDKLQALQAALASEYPGVTIRVRELDVCNSEQVFAVFRGFRDDFGTLERIIVNAGMGKGAALGTGMAEANRLTAQTNFMAAITQCEAALEIFRAQNGGHLVTISSMSAVRGLPGSTAVYAASKAGLRVLTEGLRAELHGTAIKVSCIMPGFILTPINEHRRRAPFRVSLDKGVDAIVQAIEAEQGEAWVPAWPWWPVGWILCLLPVSLLKKLAR